MGVLVVPKYPKWQGPVATAIQEFDAQRLRQKFLRCSLAAGARSRPHDA
jgi:hypothetical protein